MPNGYIYFSSWGQHGAWCWYKIVPLLEAKGHKLIAIDLPGHGIDRTLTSDLTLQVYVDRIADVIDPEPQNVILVSHSVGGMTISQVTEQRAEKIDAVVFLAAAMVGDGQSVIDAGKLNLDSAFL